MAIATFPVAFAWFSPVIAQLRSAKLPRIESHAPGPGGPQEQAKVWPVLADGITMSKVICSSGCDSSNEPYPFYYPPTCLMDGADVVKELGMAGDRPDMGIYADDEAKLTDTWIDGTRGVGEWEEDECMPLCVICHEEAVHAPERIVEVGNSGRWAKLAKALHGHRD